MVRYARNAIEEFRRAKREKNILFRHLCPSVQMKISVISKHYYCNYLLRIYGFLTLTHVHLSCWRCVSLSSIKWVRFLTTLTSTCCIWCIRPWASVSSPRTMTERSDTARKLSSSTCKNTHNTYCIYTCASVYFVQTFLHLCVFSLVCFTLHTLWI